MRDLVWGRANQLVWLDYERPLIMMRVIRRSVWRAITRKPMWNENREDWRSWADPEHPIRWAWVKHGERRRKYPELLRRPEYAHLEVLRLRHPRETRRLAGRRPRRGVSVSRSLATSGRLGSIIVPGPRSSAACTGSPPKAGQYGLNVQ